MAKGMMEAVKELRETMGAGLMDCKNALKKAQGDIEAAKRILKEQGMAKAEKKKSREASEGVVKFVIASDKKSAAMVMINCETDFVARNPVFTELTEDVAKTVLSSGVESLEDLNTQKMESGKTVTEAVHAAVLKVGENVKISKASFLKVEEGFIFGYLHGQGLGVLVEVSADNEQAGRNVAMHIAALSPVSVSDSDIPESLMAEEKAVYTKQLEDSGKPDQIKEKIILGKLKKFASGLCLYGQAYVKEPKLTVKEYLSEQKLSVLGFKRYALGEGESS